MLDADMLEASTIHFPCLDPDHPHMSRSVAAAKADLPVTYTGGARELAVKSNQARFLHSYTVVRVCEHMISEPHTVKYRLCMQWEFCGQIVVIIANVINRDEIARQRVHRIIDKAWHSLAPTSE